MSDIDEVNIRRLDGTLLLVMRELLRQRRTTAAAQRLGLSQSAVSHALGRLRDLTGDVLFLRRPHGLEPTRRALELAPVVDEMLALADEAVGGGPGFDPALTERRFVIGASDFMSALAAGPLLSVFETRAPRAEAVFRFALGGEALEALRRGEVDLALGRFAQTPDDLAFEPLFEDRYVLVARAGHPAFRRPVDRAAFARMRRLAVSPAGGERDEVDAVLRRMGLPRKTVGSTPRFLTAFGAVAQTDAVTIAPARLARRYAPRLGLEMAEPPFRLASLKALAVRRRGPRADPAADWLLEMVRLAVAEEQG